MKIEKFHSVFMHHFCGAFWFGINREYDYQVTLPGNEHYFEFNVSTGNEANERIVGNPLHEKR